MSHATVAELIATESAAPRVGGNPSVSGDSGRLRLLLVGNPNVGKSVFFNHLSGLYVDVSNFPGTTVEVSRASYGRYEVYDTPGIYGVSSFNDEERVARDSVLQADVVLNIVNAVHLERDLFLTQQLIDMGKPVVVCLNMMDEMRAAGMELDLERLEAELGVEVVPTVAVRGEGFTEMEAALERARTGRRSAKLARQIRDLAPKTGGNEAEALLVLEGDPVVAQRHGLEPGTEREVLYIGRRHRVNELLDDVVRDTRTQLSLSARLGRWAVHPVYGMGMLVVALALLYFVVGDLVAQQLVGWTEGVLGNELWEPFIRDLVGRVVPATSVLGTILVGEFGLLTMTVTYLLCLLLPLVVGFYLSLSILEDSGYLPRLATLVDRSLTKIGLNGRAVIPLILGLGCVTAATVTTRLLGSHREKTIATAILQFAIPCSAQLAVIAALLATAGPLATALYAVIIFGCLALLGTALDRLIPGESSALLIDLPPMRLPRAKNVGRKTWMKTVAFMQEATPWFALGALVCGILQVTGGLDLWQRALQPLTVGWLKLPPEAATAFVMGLVRRDFGAAGLYSMQLNPMQVVVALTTITLFVPCIASIMVTLKERGSKQALVIWFGTWILAFAIGGLVAQVLVR